MPSVQCFSFLCLCSWRFRRREVRQKTIDLLRKLYIYLDKADEKTNEMICHLVKIGFLAPFSIESFDNVYGNNFDISKTIVESKQMDRFLDNLKRFYASNDNNCSSDIINIANELQYILTRSTTCDNPIYGDLLPQVELILKQQAIKDWNKYLNESKLLDDFNPSISNLILCNSDFTKQLRIGSWNLNRFNLSKAKHPGFMEVICITILRAKLSLLLLQEIADLEVANLICDELNHPTLPYLRKWCAKSTQYSEGSWKSSYSIQPTGMMYRGKEYALFLYNTKFGIEMTELGLLERLSTSQSNQKKSFTRSPCAVSYRIRNSTIVVISVHLKATGLKNSKMGRTIAEIKSLGTLVQAFYETQPSGTHLIIAGDFNLHPSHEGEYYFKPINIDILSETIIMNPSDLIMYNVLHQHGMCSILNGKQSTSLSCSMNKSTQPRAYDNAWLSADLVLDPQTYFSECAHWTGKAGVIIEGLKHPLIPNESGAGANGFVSDHAPIWFDIYVP